MMTLKRVLTGAVLAGLVFTGMAQAQPAKDPSTVRAGEYAVEPGHTQVLFSVSHLGFTTFTGIFSGVSGTLTLDPKAPNASKVAVSIPVASVYTPVDKLTGELKSPMFFDAATFPTITFVSKSVTQTGPTTAKIAGDLTLHGVTHPVVLDATLHGFGDGMMHSYNVGFDATTHLSRSDFGVKFGVPYVGDEVTVTIAGAFVKK